MNQTIIYPNQNGSISAIIPVGNVAQAVKDVPKNTPYKIVSSLDIDNDFFNAYEYDETDGAKVNLEKAKAIHKDKWRAARKPKLEKLDIDFMRAVELGDAQKQSEIAAQKQALRDVTETPLDGTTLEEIKAVWPAILN
jgi:CO dehydrogenase/acetyl-CoA synthase alpha subunit